MTLLVPVMARGDLAAIKAAVVAAAACSAGASGNTSVTSPMSLASCALKTRAVKASSLALPARTIMKLHNLQSSLRPLTAISKQA